MVRLYDVLTFFLEMAVYLGVAWWAFQLVDPVFLAVALALVAIAVMAIIWATFGSPHARRPLYGRARILLEIGWFGLGVVAYIAAGAWPIGAALAAVFLIMLGVRLSGSR